MPLVDLGPAPVKKKAKLFDPEGTGYDMESALRYGLKPDPNSGHWQSRIPQTGLLLKGKQHKTWDLLEKGEEEAGHEIYKGKDGRYYSRPKKKELIDLGPAPTPIMEAIGAVEPTTEDIDKYRQMGVDEYRSPAGKLYDLTEPTKKISLPGPEFATTPRDIRPSAKPLIKGLPEIGRAMKEMVAPTTPYTRRISDKISKEIPDRLKWMLTYGISLGGRAAPILTFGQVKGSDLRKELLKEAEEFAGFGPAVVPVGGEATELAIEWGWLYPKLFKAAGLVNSQIVKIPKVAKGMQALKRLGGIEKFAKKFPRLYQGTQQALSAFIRGAEVGSVTAGAEVIGEELPTGEVLKHISKRAAILGGIAATFQLASQVDTARYVKQLRNTLIKASNQRFAAKLTEVGAMPKTPAKSRALNSLKSLKRIELQTIDNIVSRAEAQLRGLKAGKIYQQGQEMVESPQQAAERFARYGLESAKLYPKGEPLLKKGLGKAKPFIEMPKTRVAEIVEEARAAVKAMKAPKAVRPAPAKMPVKPLKPTPVVPGKPSVPVAPSVAPTAPRVQALAKELQKSLKLSPEAALRVAEKKLAYDARTEAEIAEMDREVREIQRPAEIAKITPEPPPKAITPEIPPTVAKEPWEMNLQEFAEAELDKGTIIAEGVHFREKGQVVIAAFKNKKTGKVIETGAVHDLNKIPKGGFESGHWDIGFVEEGRFYGREAYRFRQAKEAHREIIRKALFENKPVPKNILLQYKSEKWAQEALKKIKAPTPAEPPTVKPAKLVDLGPAKPEIIDLSDKTRKKALKQTEQKIAEHEIYQNEIAALETAEREIGPGYYYVTPELKGEVLIVTGKPGQKGFKSELYKSFTFTDPKATSWAKAAQERGIEDIDISEFVQRVDDAIEARKEVGALNQQALERAIASKDPYFEILAMKREMLKDGLSAAEINDNIREQAKHYGIPESTIADQLAPIERIEVKDVEAKQRMAEEVARKGRKAKAKLSPEQAATIKAKTVVRKLKAPVYIYEKQGRFTVSKNPPTKGPYTKVSPLKPGEIKHVVTKGKIERPTAIELTPEQMRRVGKLQAQADTIAKQKGLISHRGKPTQSYRRFAKAMTGKTSMAKMTEEEAEKFIDGLDALPVDYRGIAHVPTSKHIITKELADKIGKFPNIGFLERFRPAWRVFEKMGLYKEVFEPAFEAEISSIEELFAFRAEAKQMQKLVGKDKATSQKLFDVLEGVPAKLTANERKVVQWGKKHYDDWANRLNLPEEKRRKNYITHIFEADIAEGLREKHPLDPDLVRALDFITPKTIFNPFLQKRLGKKVGLKRDFWAAIEAYERKALKKFYYEPLIKRIRVYQRFLPANSARYLRNYVTRITNRPLVIDKEVNQTLKELGKDLAKLPGGKQLAPYLTKGNASGMMAYNITGIYYEAWLGLRPASAIKNLSQHGLILAETGAVNLTKALTTRGDERARLLTNSKALRSRKLGYLPGIDQTYIQSLESKRRKISMAMFRMADRQNVSDAFLAGYYEAKSKGLPNELAYKRGDEVAQKTQYLYSKLAGAEFMQTSPGRILGVLTTWPENWAELMNDWIRAKPSRVYADYEKTTGKKMGKTNWAARRKSLWRYLALVSLAMLIHKRTRFKALYYTGWTSIKSLVDIASGKLAGLELPRIIGNLVTGIALGDKRRIKQSWNEMKRFVVIVRELKDIISGKKDWLSLFVYLEKPKKKETKKPTGLKRKPTGLKRKTRLEREKRLLRK